MYAFSDSKGAPWAFAQRTLNSEFPSVVRHLRPGSRVVDIGCGSGSITRDVAAVVAPGEVIGFDTAAGMIETANAALADSALQNVRFHVGSAYDFELPDASFDCAMFCGVLMHLKDPAAVLARVMRALKPGGLLAAREANKDGDWYSGPNSDALRRINGYVRSQIAAGGGDPYIGRRLPELLAAAGFERIEVEPSYSPTLSSPRVVAGFLVRRTAEPGFVNWAVENAQETPAGLAELGKTIEAWSSSPDSLAALCECVALAWKPEA